METICKVENAKETDEIRQGDIYKDIKYIYKVTETGDYMDIIEFEYPYIIVLSQACDVDGMSKLMSAGGGKIKKFMPSVLVAPVFDKEVLKKGKYMEEVVNVLPELNIDSTGGLFTTKEFDIIKNDDFSRFHNITLDKSEIINLKNPMIDFKHYFTVSPEQLHAKSKQRICHIKELNFEQITLRFSNYLSRVGFPEDWNTKI